MTDKDIILRLNKFGVIDNMTAVILNGTRFVDTDNGTLIPLSRETLDVITPLEKEYIDAAKMFDAAQMFNQSLMIKVANDYASEFKDEYEELAKLKVDLDNLMTLVTERELELLRGLKKRQDECPDMINLSELDEKAQKTSDRLMEELRYQVKASEDDAVGYNRDMTSAIISKKIPLRNSFIELFSGSREEVRNIMIEVYDFIVAGHSDDEVQEYVDLAAKRMLNNQADHGAA